MNALLALGSVLEQAGICTQRGLATASMLTAMGLSVIVWFELAWRLLRSLALATLVALLIVLNPSFEMLSRDFYYPNVELALLGIGLLLIEGWSRRPSHTRLAAVVFVVALLVHTRALWHPAAGLGLAGLLGAWLWMAGAGRARAASTALAAAGLFAALVAPWMLKNKLLFNFAGFSSWIGLNSKNLMFRDNPAWDFAETGLYDEDFVRRSYTDAQWRQIDGHPALVAIKQSVDGQPKNLNALAIPPLSAMNLRLTIAAYRERPSAYLEHIAEHWVYTDLPAHFRIYTLDRETGNYEFEHPNTYARLFDQFYYGAWLRKFWSFQVAHLTWRPSFYIVAILPLAVIGALLRLRRVRRPRGLVSALMLASLIWVWAMILLIDGAEGARMRWHIEPLTLILFLWTLLDVKHSLHARSLARRRRLALSRQSTD